MRVCVLFLIVSIFLFPISVQQTNNPVYIATNGKIRVGTWLYYEITDIVRNSSYYMNFTIVWMNDTHIHYNYTIYYPENNIIYNLSSTWNVSYQVRVFWCNISWYAELLKKVNNTVIGDLITTFIYELNKTYIHYRIWFNSTQSILEIEGTFLVNTDYIVLRRTVGCRTIELVNSSFRAGWKYYNISRLIEIHTPKESEGGGIEWVRIDTGYIVLGLIVVALALGYWWFSKEVKKSVGTEAELR